MMIKEAVIGLFSNIDPIIADRYYFRFHGPDVVFASGPWLRRYVTYRTYEPPPEAVTRFNIRKGRYTELWYTSIEEYMTRPGMAAWTDPPWDEKTEARDTAQALLMIPVTPTEDFLGKEPKHEKTTIMRWIYTIRYPKEISIADGEKWYLNIHAPEVNRQPGLLRHISYKAIQLPGPPPGIKQSTSSTRGKKGSAPWLRISEQWYKDVDTWYKAVNDSSLKYTPPKWSGDYPFFEMLSSLVHYRFDVDFLKGNYMIP